MSDNPEPYQPEKLVWSDADFDVMGWHDVCVHAFGFIPERSEFVLDIDYIYKWVDPPKPYDPYRFWISPCTLVFENVSSVVFNFKSFFGGKYLYELKRSVKRVDKNSGVTYRWWMLDFGIRVKATGYKQYTRQHPRLTDSQELTYDERGGISFAREFTE